MFIYLVTNLIDGKRYVGKTREKISKRWRDHLQNAKSQKRQEYLYRAIRKHGPQSFSVECLASTNDPSELSRLEQFCILCLQTYAPGGYNMTYGGDGNPATPEVRARISRSRTGQRTSELQKSTASKTFKGKPKSAEQRHNMAAAWDDGMRKKQAAVARRVNEVENAKLRDFTCSKCKTEFRQVTKSVFGGHRKACLARG